MKAKFLALVSMLALLSGCGSEKVIDVEFQTFAETSYGVDGAKLVVNVNNVFESDRKSLRPEAVKVLRSLYRQVEGEYYANVEINAYCDDALTEKTALEVTNFQAQVVAGYFWFRGIPAAEIESNGLGFTHPIADMSTPFGVYTNQRIEILLT